MKKDLEKEIDVDSIVLNSELLEDLNQDSKNRYKKLLFLGFCEFILWISFILMTIFAIVSGELDFFLEGLLYAIPALAIDFFVLKNYRKTPEFYQLRNDIMAIPSRIKAKFNQS